MKTTFSEAGLARVLEAVKADPYNGPWSFLEEGCTEDEHNAGRPLTLSDAAGNDVANFYSSDDATVSISREQAIKNVRLAAAAPDLYAAADNALKVLIGSCIPINNADAKLMREAKEMLCAAIAKALGSQQ